MAYIVKADFGGIGFTETFTHWLFARQAVKKAVRAGAKVTVEQSKEGDS